MRYKVMVMFRYAYIYIYACCEVLNGQYGHLVKPYPKNVCRCSSTFGIAVCETSPYLNFNLS